MQTRKQALVEVLLNIATGFIVSSLIQQFVITPLYHLPVSVANNLEITLIFTVISILRSYAFRRVFNRLGRKV